MAPVSAQDGAHRPTVAKWRPSRPLRIVAGPPGGILDTAARLLAERLAADWGQQVIVDNRPGAGGILPMVTTAESAADGHTVGLASFVELVVNPWLFERLPYDPQRDLMPVSMLFASPLLMVALPSLGVRSLPDLIAVARTRPGALHYGSSGVARPPHIYAERFKWTAGVDLVHVPYNGGAALARALQSNEVPLGIEGAAGLLPHVAAGRLTPLAVSGDSRMKALPTVPTFGECGLPGIGMPWIAAVAPAGTPPAIVDGWQRGLAGVLAAPEVRAINETAGRTTLASTPQALAAAMRRERDEWRVVVKATGLKAE